MDCAQAFPIKGWTRDHPTAHNKASVSLSFRVWAFINNSITCAQVRLLGPCFKTGRQEHSNKCHTCICLQDTASAHMKEIKPGEWRYRLNTQNPNITHCMQSQQRRCTNRTVFQLQSGFSQRYPQRLRRQTTRFKKARADTQLHPSNQRKFKVPTGCGSGMGEDWWSSLPCENQPDTEKSKLDSSCLKGSQ